MGGGSRREGKGRPVTGLAPAAGDAVTVPAAAGEVRVALDGKRERGRRDGLGLKFCY